MTQRFRLSTAALFAASALLPAAASAQQTSGPTIEEFRDPPASARPRVWWHWMNGNVTEDGIAKDLEWMKRIGIGGAQAFDAALSTPQIVDKRLVYMTPEWKQAFRFAAQKADALGLELATAASPGWSETGGPWVKPEQAMKKLVWSERLVPGGKRFSGVLAKPPSVTGPWQDVPLVAGEHARAPDFYRDALVLAYRQPAAAAALPKPVSVAANGVAVDGASLFDGRYETGIPLPGRDGSQPGNIVVDFGRPQTIRSATAQIANRAAGPGSAPMMPTVEASDDGTTWRRIADMQLADTPSTASFAPVTARWFRLVLKPGKGFDASSFAVAPGVDISALSGLGSLIGQGQAKPSLAEFRLTPAPRVHAAELKASFGIANDYYAIEGDRSEVEAVAPQNVVDLTGRMSADGRLDWTPPKGNWKVLRLGYSLTGKTNHPATDEATGLEVDKYDAAAVESYLTTYLGMYRDAAGADLMGKRGLKAIVTDSTEVGPANWTPRIVEQFKRLRGYDPTRWLPALTGEIVGSRARTDGFLYDWRRTLGELAASEHYGTVARVAHGSGLIVYGESLEGNRVIGGQGDDIDLRAHADIPMAAMWTYAKGGKPGNGHWGDMRGAASAGHLYGRRAVAAESLTSIMQPWSHSPADLKPMIDTEFVAGINLPVIHTSPHQPVDDKVPGLSLMLFGQFFTRHETWAEMARPWIDYMARSSYLLQQGRNVADVGWFVGEEAPIAVQADSNGIPRDLPTRNAYDFVSPGALLGALSVEGEEVVSTGGARYRLLYLGGTSERMTLPVLHKLAALAESGATIVGDAPKSSPSLADDASEFAALVKKLWSGGAITQVGKGRIIAGRDIDGALASAGVKPDFAYAGGQPDTQLAFVHRTLGDGELYYVSNRKDRPEQVEARFRVTGKLPEIWRADTGTAEPVSYRIEGGETVVPLNFGPSDSYFLSFRKPAAAPSVTIARPVPAQVAGIEGEWSVAFQPGRGAPASIKLATLGSLSEQADAGVKYFSGTATYSRSFTLPKGVKPGAPLWLDLGKVGDVAEVRVNGKVAGIAWKAPYRLDVGALTRKGANSIEVRVANLWVNRLIGDKQPAAEKVTFTTFSTYTAKAPLRPSGLIGPVTLWSEGE